MRLVSNLVRRAFFTAAERIRSRSNPPRLDLDSTIGVQGVSEELRPEGTKHKNASLLISDFSCTRTLIARDGGRS